MTPRTESAKIYRPPSKLSSPVGNTVLSISMRVPTSPEARIWNTTTTPSSFGPTTMNPSSGASATLNAYPGICPTRLLEPLSEIRQIRPSKALLTMISPLESMTKFWRNVNRMKVPMIVFGTRFRGMLAIASDSALASGELCVQPIRQRTITIQTRRRFFDEHIFNRASVNFLGRIFVAALGMIECLSLFQIKRDEFLEDHRIIKQVTVTSQDSTIYPIDCNWHSFTDEIIVFVC